MTQTSEPSLLRPSHNCWRIEKASRVSVIVDAEDYFLCVRDAMLKARRRIVLVGWDFDSEIALDRTDEDIQHPQTIGRFLSWIVEQNPDLEVYVLRWDIGALSSLLRLPTLKTLMRWIVDPRIHIQLDRHHPFAASHHQKIVVLDENVAFCGGIDMTVDRWDTRKHLDGDQRRRRPNGELSDPWHDATTALEGPVVTALAELCRTRWEEAGGGELPPIVGETSCWPDRLSPAFEDVSVAISRTKPLMDDQPATTEIENLYVDLIASARRCIYAESQYFASRRIAIALAERLEEPDGPEVVVLNPLVSEGWLDQFAMDTARARVVQALRRRDIHDRFRLYHPYSAGGTPIYVHAKILIVDDRILRIGSSNMNNRSLRLDTECDVTIDADLCGRPDVKATISALRRSLLAEHLDADVETVAAIFERTGSIIAVIEELRQGSGRTLEPYSVPHVSDVEAWLADNEILDPEGPVDMFEPMSKRGLFQKNSMDFRIKRRSSRT